MRSAFSKVVIWVLIAGLLNLPGCRGRTEYPNRPILLVCPWSAGGGTDRVSRQVAALLEQELGAPVNVVNATGGGGVTGHTRGALARPDGYTITMVTVEINMLHWRGLTNLAYQDYQPVGLLNQDAAALFVRQDAPWQDVTALAEHVREHPGEIKASGTAHGGIWHLGFAGWLDVVGIDPSAATWISINGAAPSLQELLAGGVDIACCSLPEAAALLESGRIRCLGVMSKQRVSQFSDVPTLREQGVEWTLLGWRGVCLPKGCPPDVHTRLSTALERVVHSEPFAAFMRDAGFDSSWQPPGEFALTMRDADEQLGRLLNSPAMQSMERTRVGPHVFPTLLAILGAAALVGLTITGGLRRSPRIPVFSRQDMFRMVEVIICVIAYLLLAESLGFIITAALLLSYQLWRAGNRWSISIATSLAVVLMMYQVFAVLLRVPLPRGWLGW